MSRLARGNQTSGPRPSARGGTSQATKLMPSRARPPSRLSLFAARRPITAFLILVFSISYPLMAAVALAVHRVIPGRALIDQLPISAEELAGLLLTLFALLPAAVYVTWASDGPTGVRLLLRRVTRWRFGWGWWLFLLTALPITAVAAGLLLGDSFQPPAIRVLFLDQLRLLVINFILINLWEETAWAGVLQTRLERRHNLFTAAFITAVPFGFAHWPLVLLLDSMTLASAAVSLAAYILLGVLVRPLAALVMRGARDSVLAFALLHSIFNRSNNPDGVAASVLSGQAYQIGILAALVVLTITVGLILRRRLGSSYRHHLENDSAPPQAENRTEEAA